MQKRQKVLFVCTGNSCRSQIAEGLLKELANHRYEAFSAGSHPSRVNPNAIAVMKEWGIDISGQTSESVNDYLDKGIEVVITVCDNANEICPVFLGNTIRIHWSIEDPFSGWDADKLRLDAFRKTRDLIKSNLTKFLSITEVH
jgi:arsenate reductase|tara:strand:- start:14521 stop:14949 length:429 start_codon:yes stop_codon:yes gene_type:complete